MNERVAQDPRDTAKRDTDRSLAKRVRALERQLETMTARLASAQPAPSAGPPVGPEPARLSDAQVDQALARVAELAGALRDQPAAPWDAREAVLVRAVLRDLALVVGHLQQQAGDSDRLVAAAQDGRTAITVDPAALRMLEQYEWPGNVRELENLCRRAVTLCTGATVTPALIAPWLTQTVERDAASLGLREGHLLEDMERKLIIQTLERFNGHREKSARALGMGVRTLTMKLKKWREERASEWNASATISSRSAPMTTTTGSFNTAEAEVVRA